jgi:4'-phosphopantetheinyl transferase
MAGQTKSKIVQFLMPGNDIWQLGNDIHIWKFPSAMASVSLLTASEKNISSRFRFEQDRKRFTAGRYALRLLLSKYLSTDLSEISIIAEPGQKPFVSIPSNHIHFNISHSGEWVLIAFANQEVGIDIEMANPAFEFHDLLEEHFSEEEQQFIKDSGDPSSTFFYLWTRKEALTKAWGTGLQENLKQILVLTDLTLYNNHWNLESFYVSANYPAAVAFSDQRKIICYFDGTGL